MKPASRSAPAATLDRSVDTVGRLRAPRRGSGGGAGCGRRPDPLRRDGQSLRAEPDDRPAGVRGAAQARRHRADRRAPDGEAGRSHHSGFRAGGRHLDHVSSGSERARRSHDRADPRARLPARPGVQSGDAAQLARPRDRQDRHGADDVREPRLRRPEVHPVGAATSCARRASASTPAGARSAWRSTAA